MDVEAIGTLGFGIGGFFAGILAMLNHAARSRETSAKDCEEKLERTSRKYDDLLDRYDMMVQKYSDKRAEAHDLRGEVLEWRKTMKKGGRRYLDPKG